MYLYIGIMQKRQLAVLKTAKTAKMLANDTNQTRCLAASQPAAGAWSAGGTHGIVAQLCRRICGKKPVFVENYKKKKII